MERVKGLDVSQHQPKAGPVDFAAVYAAGYRFCYVKLTEGEDYDDPHGPALWRAAQAAGLLVGGYHFARFFRDGARQAEGFSSALAALGGGDLPPAVDLESHKGDWEKGAPTPARVREVSGALLGEVERRTGRRAIVYTAAWFADPNGLGAFAERDLWLAGYVAEQKLRVPKGWAGWRIWQHSGKGKVPGITGDVDLNVFAGSEKDLANWAREQRHPL